MEFLGIIVCLLIMAVYYGVMLYSLKFCGIDFVKIFSEERLKILIVLAIGTAFIAYQVSLQKTIYNWDWVETWLPTVICNDITFTDPLESLKQLRYSINYLTYNNFLPMLMTLPTHLFGESFLAYTTYVWVMFALPALFLTAASVKATIKKIFDVEISCAAALAILTFVPQLQIPVLVGYANIAMILNAIVLWLILLSLDTEKFQPKRLICAAILSMFAILQSRSASYMVLGVHFGYAAYEIYLGVVKEDFRERFVATIKNLFAIGIIAAGLTTILFFPLVKHILTYNYSEAYAAYGAGFSFWEKVFAAVQFGGIAIYSIFFIGVIAGIFSKKIRPLAIFSLVWAVLPILLISHIQLLGVQHYYAMLTPFCAVLIVTILIGLRRSKIFGGVLILLLAVNFLQTYANFLPDIFMEKYSTPIRNDVEDMRNFVDELNSLADGRQIYPLSSSNFYNCSSFKQADFPNKRDALPTIIYTPGVDLSNGFSIEFFDADLVIVADPPQTHLRPEDQTLVVKLGELVTSEPLARHFKPVLRKELNPTGNPNDTVTLTVYEKIYPYDEEDINFVENTFNEIYPNNPELFKDRFERYKEEHFHQRNNEN